MANQWLVIGLFVAIAFVSYVKLTESPYKKYSTTAYWEEASAVDVFSIPDEAFSPVNEEGPILMWAASATTDPDVIDALLSRGSKINEQASGIFNATPMSAAAAASNTPAVIDRLVERGADVNVVVGTRDKTPLIIASEINFNPEIIRTLLKHGADPAYRDAEGRNALEQAKHFNNAAAVEVLSVYEDDSSSNQAAW